MKKLSKAVILLFILSVSMRLNAQWAMRYGGNNNDERAYSVRQTSDGGYIVAGETYSYEVSEGDFWVLKLASDGAIEWQKSYGGSSSDFARSVAQTSDGGYIVAGRTFSFGAGYGNSWILKLKQDGTPEWQKAYGNNYTIYSIVQTSDSGYIAAGTSSDEFWVLKLASDGAIVWQKSYGGMFSDEAHSIVQTSDGGYIVAGETYSDIWILKLASDGAIEWQKSYGGSYSSHAYSIVQTSEGGYIVAGDTLFSDDLESSDFWVLKLKSDGAIEWQKSYGGSLGDGARSIVQTSDGGYIVAGITGSVEGQFLFPVGSQSAWVLKLKANGEIEWQLAYGGNDSNGPREYAYSIQQTSDGGYVVAGETHSFGTWNYKTDCMVLKLGPNGDINPSCDFITSLSASTTVTTVVPIETYAIAQDANASLIATSALAQETDANSISLCEIPKNTLNISLNMDIGLIQPTSPLPGTYEFYTGTEVSVYYQGYFGEEKNYEFSAWTGNVPQGHEKDYPLVIIMDSNKSITANYVVICELYIDSAEHGTTLPKSGRYKYNEGALVTVTAIPDSGYQFSRWMGDYNGSDNPVTLVMSCHRGLTPFFNESKGRCFIASAAYGLPSHPHVRILQDFRNRYLMPNKIGRKLVGLYYRYSPSVAECIARHKLLKAAARLFLLPLVAFSYSLLHFGPIITALVIGQILSLLVFLVLIGGGGYHKTRVELAFLSCLKMIIYSYASRAIVLLRLKRQNLKGRGF